jgi:hypothetical protein
MQEEYPSNSRRPPRDVPLEEAKTPIPVEQPTLEKVVTGKVMRKKKSFAARLKATFFSNSDGAGVVESTLSYVFVEVIVPAIQDIVINSITQGIEKAIHGEVRSPGRPSTRGSAGARHHTAYNRPTISYGPAATRPTRPPIHQPSSEEIDDVVVDTLVDAQFIAERLCDTVENYHVASVARLNELLGTSSTPTDHRWGWTDLSTLSIRRVRHGYRIVLPPVEDIR